MLLHRHHDDARQRAAAGQRRLQLPWTMRSTPATRSRRTKADEQLRQYGLRPVRHHRHEQDLVLDQRQRRIQYTSPNLLAVLPDGTTTTDTIRQPRDSFNLNGRVDHAINKDHAVRLSFDRTYDRVAQPRRRRLRPVRPRLREPCRPPTVRLSENGPIGRRMFTEIRLQFRWTDSASQSVVEAPTIRVLDAFTSGGAQQRGGQHRLRRRAGLRPRLRPRGALVADGRAARRRPLLAPTTSRTTSARTRSRAWRTTTLGRAAELLAPDRRPERQLLDLPGRPLRAGRLPRRAQPAVSRRACATACRITSGDAWNVSPRVTAAWSPLRNGSLTIRGGYGYFYDWIAGDLYKQTLLFDGVRQRED